MKEALNRDAVTAYRTKAYQLNVEMFNENFSLRI